MTHGNKKGQDGDRKNRKKPTVNKGRMKTKVPKTRAKHDVYDNDCYTHSKYYSDDNSYYYDFYYY